MIVAIADDFSGAAEIGGLAWRYGLKVSVQSSTQPNPDYDVIVLDLDTRSDPLEKAVKKTETLVSRLDCFSQVHWYKKIDSVLRGHILTELEILMNQLGKKYALMIPQNPSRGRTIRNGRYYINGKLIHQTEFSKDPEFPRRKPEIEFLFENPQGIHIKPLKPGQKISDQGIYLGEAQTEKHVTSWVSLLNDGILPVGGSDFFQKILESMNFRERNNGSGVTRNRSGLRLHVLGSSTIRTHPAFTSAENRKYQLCGHFIPPEIFPVSLSEEKDAWTLAVLKAFRNHNEVVAFINLAESRGKEFTGVLKSLISEMVSAVASQIRLSELIIEGGATASSIIRKLGWNCMIPVMEYHPGVVTMRVKGEENLLLTVKPGSYPWPQEW